MEINVVVQDIAKVQADAIVINLFEGTESPAGATGVVDKSLDGIISDLIRQGELKGKFNEISIIHTYGRIPARIVAVVGLGKRDDLTPDRIRIIIAQACRLLRNLNCRRIATVLHGAGEGGMDYRQVTQAIIEGSTLGLYRFRRHMTKEFEDQDINELLIVEREKTRLPELESSCLKGKIVADAVILARDMVNEPANYFTPSDMADKAGELARTYNLDFAVMDFEQIKKEGMQALLGVAQGSEQPPRFITLSYKGDAKSKNTIGLVGKAITFDSGGISIKPSENMKDMKGDMAGGAAVLAAMTAIAQLKPKVNVTALIPATENLPSGKALKPGDVLNTLSGKTIEIISTDAEGRLILADALAYGVKSGFTPLIDLATLTGACRMALGDICSGIMGNNQDLINKIIEAGDQAGERLWQFPMYDEYKELNNSEVADIKNTGGRYAGTITAAQFLSEFVGDAEWAHLDIAGTELTDKERGYNVKGATGVGVRTLINYVMNIDNQKKEGIRNET